MGKQALYVQEDQHPVIDRTETADVVDIDYSTYLRRGLYLAGSQLGNVRNAVDDNADDLVAEAKDNDDR